LGKLEGFKVGKGCFGFKGPNLVSKGQLVSKGTTNGFSGWFGFLGLWFFGVFQQIPFVATNVRWVKAEF
jgi:hypothetical protein